MSNKNELAQRRPHQLPTLEELNGDLELAGKMDDLNAILNHPPPARYIKQHPFVKVKVMTQNGEQSVNLPYLPVEIVKNLLVRIFQRYEWHITNVLQIFNSVTITGTLRVLDPVTGEWMQHDGIGSVGVQTDAGSGAADMSRIKTDAVMKAAPAAESYALKNAAEKFGKIFGGDMLKDTIPFSQTYNKEEITLEDLQELYELKKDALGLGDRVNAERIINTQEKASFAKLHRQLSSL